MRSKKLQLPNYYIILIFNKTSSIQAFENYISKVGSIDLLHFVGVSFFDVVLVEGRHVIVVSLVVLKD